MCIRTMPYNLINLSVRVRPVLYTYPCGGTLGHWIQRERPDCQHHLLLTYHINLLMLPPIYEDHDTPCVFFCSTYGVHVCLNTVVGYFPTLNMNHTVIYPPLGSAIWASQSSNPGLRTSIPLTRVKSNMHLQHMHQLWYAEEYESVFIGWIYRLIESRVLYSTLGTSYTEWPMFHYASVFFSGEVDTFNSCTS